jgi:nuclear pore complex protein Nup205
MDSTISAMNDFESLHALHADLLALSESRLSSVDRLETQLGAHIQDLKALLDKNTRKEQSRQKLATGISAVSPLADTSNMEFVGRLDIGDGYTVNDEFKNIALQVADELNLDELDAAQLCLESQNEAEFSGRPLLACALIRFHRRRLYVLECVRLILQVSADVDLDEDLQRGLQGMVMHIVQPQDPMNKATKYVRRCLAAMAEIKALLQKLTDKLNSASVLGQGPVVEFEDVLEFQRISLVKQHESLGVIFLYLVKQNYSDVGDFEAVLETVKKADKFDNILGKLH